MWEDPKKYLTLWTEAMRAKYLGEGEPWGRREFDVVLGKFDVCLSLPFSSPLSLPGIRMHAFFSLAHPSLHQCCEFLLLNGGFFT